MSTTITVEGQPVDVTTCAKTKCGSHPMSNPKYREVADIGMFRFGKKNDPRLRGEYENALKAWHRCVTTKCEAEAREKLGLKARPVTDLVGTVGSIPVSKPVQTRPVNVGQSEPRPDTTENQGYKAGEEEEEESWFKTNRNTVIIGGVLLVLAVGGFIMYRKMNK